MCLAWGAIEGSLWLDDLSVSTASLPASIVSSSSSSSSSVAGHMMYPGGHTVMYAAPTPSLADGSLTVLNTFPPTGHAQSHDPGMTVSMGNYSTSSWHSHIVVFLLVIIMQFQDIWLFVLFVIGSFAVVVFVVL